jgi:hypothetical protein
VLGKGGGYGKRWRGKKKERKKETAVRIPDD